MSAANANDEGEQLLQTAVFRWPNPAVTDQGIGRLMVPRG